MTTTYAYGSCRLTQYPLGWTPRRQPSRWAWHTALIKKPQIKKKARGGVGESRCRRRFASQCEQRHPRV
eukprot:scaffold42881_cov31-Tisochrysis_lutea.AAC.1